MIAAVVWSRGDPDRGGLSAGAPDQRPPAGRDTRPTSDRVREALFSTLESLDRPGRLPVRSTSTPAPERSGWRRRPRGAAAVLLVESDARAARTVRANIARSTWAASAGSSTGRITGGSLRHAPDRAVRRGLRRPAVRAGRRRGGRTAATPWSANGWLAADAVVVVERSTRSPEPAWPDGVTPERGRRYGETDALVRSSADTRRRAESASRKACNEACGLPRFVRPGDQRAPGHHRTVEPALRRGDRRRAGERVQARPVHHRRAARRCCAR